MSLNEPLKSDENSQPALETAIVLITFVVVASLIALTILSLTGTSIENSERTLYTDAGQQGDESSITVKTDVTSKNAAVGSSANSDSAHSLASSSDSRDLVLGANSKFTPEIRILTGTALNVNPSRPGITSAMREIR